MKGVLQFTFGILLLSACAKEGIEIEPTSSFEGSWKWWQKTGGIGGVYEDTVTSSDRMTLQFDTDDTYDWTKNDTLIHNGGYHSKMDTSVVLNQRVMMLTLENYPTRMIVKHKNDTLELVEDVIDGYTYRFIRK